MRLRQGPSGPETRGTNPGDLLVWNGSEWLPSVDYGAQAEWWLDPQNPAASDTNDGLTAAAPIKTRQELARRLTTPELLTAPAVTVHVESDVPSGDQFVLSVRGTAAYGAFRVQGKATTLYQGTLTGATAPNSATNTRADITIAGIDWSTAGPGGSSLLGKRIRRLSDDALSWVQFQTGAPDTVELPRPTVYGSIGFDANFAIGDEIVVEELVSFGDAFYFDWQSSYGFVSPFFEGLRITQPADGLLTVNQAVLVGCEIETLRCRFPFTLPTACKFVSSATNGSMTIHGGEIGLDFSGCWFASTGANRWFNLSQITQCSLNHCSTTNSNLNFTRGGSANIENGIEMWDWGVTAGGGPAALNVSEGRVRRVSGNIWGVSAAANTYVISVNNYSVLNTVAPAGLVAVGALNPVTDVSVGGILLPYASTPYIQGVTAPSANPNLAGII